MLTVFVVDDHEVVRRGVSDLLDEQDDLTVVGEASTVSDARTRVLATRPQVAVLDVRLPDGNGVELCRDLRSELPELRCLMLTSYTDQEALSDAILAGASGYVLKDIRGTDLVAAVRSVGQGRSLMPPAEVTRVTRRWRAATEAAPAADDPLAVLTDQERAVLGLIGEGLTNRQIGERMFLAEKTVKNYVSAVLAKLGLQRRTQVAVLATELRDRPRTDRGSDRPRPRS